jgi:hypothetical protein
MTALFVPATVIAQEESTKSADGARKDRDPERIVCKSMKQMGSMTRTVKDCRPAHEWRDMRHRARQVTEGMQVQHDP